MGIILASASPRRRDILSNIGVKFGIFTADCDEYIEDGIMPAEAVMLLSMKKCAASAKYFANEKKIVIGADTVVVFENEILTKPKDSEDAFAMLRKLSGRIHSVMTGVSIMRTSDAKCETFYEKTDVKFKDLTDEEIRAYIKTGEPLDKAGSYGIQGIGSLFIEKIDGDYFNVVGLPVCKLCEKLKNEFDINIILEGQE
ncbi:MAG: septum formation inhibitor Maf [Ruminococcaceae bacterium]|nr:septum formation inhibitor Maf [Oscillospiraceae bacterium]